MAGSRGPLDAAISGYAAVAGRELARRHWSPPRAAQPSTAPRAPIATPLAPGLAPPDQAGQPSSDAELPRERDPHEAPVVPWASAPWARPTTTPAGRVPIVDALLEPAPGHAYARWVHLVVAGGAVVAIVGVGLWLYHRARLAGDPQVRLREIDQRERRLDSLDEYRRERRRERETRERARKEA